MSARAPILFPVLAAVCLHAGDACKAGSATPGPHADPWPPQGASDAPAYASTAATASPAPAASIASAGPSSGGHADRDTDGPLVFSEKHEGGVLELAFVPPDGVQAVSSGVDDVTRLWDMRTGRLIKRFSGPMFRFQSMALSRDGTRALTAGKTGAAYWQLATGSVVTTLPGHQEVHLVALSPDERRAATVEMDGTVVLWNLEVGKEVGRMHDAGRILSLSYSADGSAVIGIRDENDVCRWEVARTGPPRCSDLAGAGRLDAADVHPGLSLTGDREGQLALWSSDSGAGVRTWMAHAKNVVSVAFSPERSTAVSSSADHSIRVWSTGNAKKLYELGAVPGESTFVALSPDGRRVLYATGDGTIHLWSPGGKPGAHL